MFQIREYIPLALFTTFGVGGSARYFCEPECENDIERAYAFAKEKGIPLFILGGGSNLLISDDGYPGLVVHPAFKGISIEKETEDSFSVHAGAGEVWDDFVIWSVKHDAAGFECLSGIPGTVGGFVFENAGAYRQNCSDHIASVDTFDMREGTWRKFSKEECAFSYHMSFFKKNPGRYFITRAHFDILRSRTVRTRCAYKDNRFDFSKMFPQNKPMPSLEEMRNAILSVRGEKGMLIMEGFESFKSAGSFFGLPPVTREDFARITREAERLDPKKTIELSPWYWEQEDGSVKIAPAFLLEFTSFTKGYRRGHVGISPKHSLAIVNYGGGTAEEIRHLAEDMKNSVFELFGVSLVPEITYVGFRA